MKAAATISVTIEDSSGNTNSSLSLANTPALALTRLQLREKRANMAVLRMGESQQAVCPIHAMTQQRRRRDFGGRKHRLSHLLRVHSYPSSSACSKAGNCALAAARLANTSSRLISAPSPQPAAQFATGARQA